MVAVTAIPFAAMLFIVLIIAIPFLFIFGVVCLIVFAIRRGSKQQGISAEETRMIQEMFTGLKRMEDRADSLETILLDKMKKDGKP